MQHRHACAPVRLVAVLAITILLAGCAGISQLRQAQDAFNEASALDRAAFHDPNVIADSGDLTQAVTADNNSRALYASALASLESMGDKEIRTLKQNRLYGTALTLKALTCWKLGLHDQAIAVCDEASRTPDALIKRDRILLDLLPSLVTLDETLPVFKGMESGSQAELDKARTTIMSLLNERRLAEIDQAIAEADDPKLKLYALEIKLLFLNRQFRTVTRATAVQPGADDPVVINAQKALTAMHAQASTVNPTKATELALKWSRKFNFAVKIEP